MKRHLPPFPPLRKGRGNAPAISRISGVPSLEFAWLSKLDSAGAVYPLRNLCKKKIASGNGVIIQHNNSVDPIRNASAV